MRIARHNFILATLVSATVGLTLSTQKALAAPALADPEVLANTWQENNQSYAAVTLNGKDLLTYKGDLQGASAEQRAEDMAEKIGELVSNPKVDPNRLLPAKEGEVAVVRIDNNTVLRFDLTNVSREEAGKKNPLEDSFRLVNAIRQAMGAPALSSSFLKLAEASDAISQVRPAGTSFSGKASWYGPQFNGRRTSDGHRFNMDGLTAAHRSLPFGTRLLVRNRKTGDSCVVEVNDRGPFVGGRMIDLSRGAARQLNMLSSGVAVVDCLVLGGSEN